MTAREKAADGEVTRGSRNRDLGRRGEEAAAKFLHRHGYDVVERNWTCAAGEADIIARVGEVLVFVEVKTRRGVSYGFPAEAVDEAKRERYRRIALSYLAERRLGEVPLRFDVVSIVVSDRRAVVRHHINAFEAS
ncbi:YraN family protein [Enterorhabdus sp. P55]|uniref:YraN family protein n=1 Tax=Enterorhabdus sp. P55 TaxID=2304571 RepID=UPI00136B1122|nr:YraN family protein [Enterorhabdus sp. P55]NBI31783.1 YraN family protein [Enterorhabdus sp. P55]